MLLPRPIFFFFLLLFSDPVSIGQNKKHTKKKKGKQYTAMILNLLGHSLLHICLGNTSELKRTTPGNVEKEVTQQLTHETLEKEVPIHSRFKTRPKKQKNSSQKRRKEVI